jgi:transposase InsO family protein
LRRFSHRSFSLRFPSRVTPTAREPRQNCRAVLSRGGRHSEGEEALPLGCGRLQLRLIVDDVTRECLAAIPDTSISGRRVARELTMLIEQRGKPGMIVSDNGTEFTSNAMLA